MVSILSLVLSFFKFWLSFENSIVKCEKKNFFFILCVLAFCLKTVFNHFNVDFHLFFLFSKNKRQPRFSRRNFTFSLKVQKMLFFSRFFWSSLPAIGIKGGKLPLTFSSARRSISKKNFFFFSGVDLCFCVFFYIFTCVRKEYYLYFFRDKKRVR